MTNEAYDKLRDQYHIISESQLKALFRCTHDVNNLLGVFSKKALILREVSVNSAIAAGHVDNESSALSEVAKQIGVLATFLTEAAEEARQINAAVSNCILNCIVESAKREKFMESLKLVETEDGIALVLTDAAKNIGGEISRRLCVEKDNLRRINPSLNRLQQIIHRTGSIVMSLKISSGIADDDENSFFAPIAESLEKIADDCVHDEQALIRLVRQAENFLEIGGQCFKKGQHAT